MRRTHFSADITEFLSLLAKHQVRSLIVGGEAVIYYGYARLTGDIDIFYEATVRNCRNLFAALVDFWKHDIPGIKTEKELLTKGMIFQFGVPPHRIDLVNNIDGVEFARAWKNREVISVSILKNRFAISYIGLDELILNKKVVGRNKDKDDLLFLVEAKRKT